MLAAFNTHLCLLSGASCRDFWCFGHPTTSHPCHPVVALHCTFACFCALLPSSTLGNKPRLHAGNTKCPSTTHVCAATSYWCAGRCAHRHIINSAVYRCAMMRYAQQHQC
ncbi:hypothetical protein COO60DRAFT_591727 [Scenedesmus sp. NREL 46B-D3]|nr:hypothetical protein COO60DRAFT_591727 [Scenedesmus sp. NREL 46B-D3]